MGYRYNPFTGKLDSYNGDTVYMSSDTYFIKNGNVLELWVNGSIAQTWEKDPLTSVGSPIGLLLGLTKTT